MNKLEEYILRNKDEFDIYTPSPSIEKRIKYRSSGQVINLMKLMKNAAAVLIIFSASYVFNYYIPLNVVFSAIFDSENHIEKSYPELYEAKQYYAIQVNNKMEEVTKHVAVYPDIAQEINYEFNELDSVYLSLKKDLKEDISNKEVVDAMIQNYKIKLQILEDILLRLEVLENKENKQVVSNTNSFEL